MPTGGARFFKVEEADKIMCSQEDKNLHDGKEQETSNQTPTENVKGFQSNEKSIGFETKSGKEKESLKEALEEHVRCFQSNEESYVEKENPNGFETKGQRKRNITKSNEQETSKETPKEDVSSFQSNEESYVEKEKSKSS